MSKQITTNSRLHAQQGIKPSKFCQIPSSGLGGTAFTRIQTDRQELILVPFTTLWREYTKDFNQFHLKISETAFWIFTKKAIPK